ncbi:MAG: hypothetical protein IT352_05670 [Gemmatimonadales bacterium]|nr:hypothetical protein [Gemmatimonadales bacterium]
MFALPIRWSIALTAAVSLAACGEAGPSEPPYEWAGTYVTATKFGGNSGTWRPAAILVIGADRSVTYGDEPVKNPSVVGNQISWSLSDGNRYNADLTLMTASDNNYFWEGARKTGKLFQGRRQTPGEGYVDFRGVVE